MVVVAAGDGGVDPAGVLALDLAVVLRPLTSIVTGVLQLVAVKVRSSELTHCVVPRTRNSSWLGADRWTVTVPFGTRDRPTVYVATVRPLSEPDATGSVTRMPPSGSTTSTPTWSSSRTVTSGLATISPS